MGALMPVALAKQWPPSRGLFHASRGLSCAPDRQVFRAAGASLLRPPGRGFSWWVCGRCRRQDALGRGPRCAGRGLGAAGECGVAANLDLRTLDDR